MDFVASTTATIANSFVDLFVDMIPILLTYVIPFVLGVAMVRWVWSKGRSLIRF